MLGFELAGTVPKLIPNGPAPSGQFVARLHQAGLLAIQAGTHVVRFLPPLNLHRQEAEDGLKLLESVVADLAA